MVDFLRGIEPAYRVLVPASAEMEILRTYPWLLDEKNPRGASWEVSFSRWGQPVRVAPSQTPVSQPQVSWVRDTGLSHDLNTRGIVTGSGSTGKLTSSGRRFIELACGLQ